MNDIQLINEILDGNKNQYAKIMDNYHNELFHYVYNIVHQYQTTEDIVQDIFIKIYKSLKKYNSEKASFRTWMYRIAHNYVFNYIKKKDYEFHQTVPLEEYNQVSDENIEEQTIKEKQIDLILETMKRVLSPKHHKIMLLHYFSNLSVKEISETMEIPDKTIYKAIKTSIEKIQKEVT